MQNGHGEVRKDVSLSDAPMEDESLMGMMGGGGGQYVSELPTDAEAAAMELRMEQQAQSRIHNYATYSTSKNAFKEMQRADEEQEEVPDILEDSRKDKSIFSRQNAYQRQMHDRMLSPPRADPFAGRGPSGDDRTHADVMQEQELDKEKQEIQRKLQKKRDEGVIRAAAGEGGEGAATNGAVQQAKKKRRWDQTTEESGGAGGANGVSRWDTPMINQGMETPSWGGTPGHSASETPMLGETPLPGSWGETPMIGGGETPGAAAAAAGAGPSKRRSSRWDATPIEGMTPGGMAMGGITPVGMTPGMTPGIGGMTPGATPFGQTPLGMTGMPSGMMTPATPMTPAAMKEAAITRDVDARNLPMTDAELDAILPKEGYEIVQPPKDYQPVRKAGPTAASLMGATPMGATPLYQIPEATKVTMEGAGPTALPEEHGAAVAGGELPDIKPEDMQYFGKLLSSDDEKSLSPTEIKERKIMRILLKIKNGTPPMRRSAFRQLQDKAREFGPGPLFNQILPLMMSSTLEDQERHLLVKCIQRVLHKLEDEVRPYVHKILVVIEPMLIDEDYYARQEGKEVISNLAKAAGLATMIATMRPDLDHPDEYVRNCTAKAFAVVASALGINTLIQFLRAVCRSKKSWQARHTGVKIVQQISIEVGCAVLPHLKDLVQIIQHGLQDEEQKVRTITALAIAALAEAATPYGIECFDSVLRPLWSGITEHRGKGLAAFLKAIGYIIPLMDPDHANYYTREVMVILVREFATPDEEMKKIVLKVVKQCVGTEGVDPQYVREEVLPAYFSSFWVVRNALDRRNYRQLVDTTVELANKVGGADIISRIVEDLKDGSEPYRKMVVETIEKVASNLGLADVDSRLEELLIDGIIYAFQEQSSDDTSVMLNGFGTIVNCLGRRVKPYLPQIGGMVRWRLNVPNARVRQQAADLVARLAGVMKLCEEETLLANLGLFLYEYLGEEYPEVLGSILGALKGIVNVIGMQNMQPPIKDLLPRLTPILKNRHEKVQENCIDLVGRIADRGADMISPKEWDRICFELLELLKAHKKAIRRATVNTFGYIAKAIGPHDVIATLLNNLKVQERQLRVCTTVAIAIVAETCGPYTVLPALMQEYKVPELNVRNGVLKSLSFMFEYIGEMGKDYVYTAVPVLEDALTDRDLVHRQTATWACKHLALGVQGLGCEEVLQHLLNFVWPNIFENSPHLIQAVFDAVDGFRVSLGAGVMLNYVMRGLWHPARRIREVYWRIYNQIYIGHQDALVAFFPKLPPDHEIMLQGLPEELQLDEIRKMKQRSYKRTELFFVL
uniref:Uncharacterized protein n=1 Tax=Chromera velia CCMP2878 TaxID=1169474 RepID=A0A0G4FKP9_9ALVE|eukprot:Cvel_17506.t1-p1 / transcript=Cvel_17506.t1 / gene=Cvel_17506 / organism=Chromera_velia_CCMP2878 / gene_product=Splicing factor 3B subunit 1, putative / transcript_product=Splicing factor 3B subunit 1, putative / location=Cvel_scaffold1402:8181-17431(-) / protein_length=1300 / sequence_SO=supercontig / SO=protein_coding / is_pseudo=false